MCIALMDYAAGWFDADMERMERSLHPQLAKRGSLSPSQDGFNQRSFMPTIQRQLLLPFLPICCALRPSRIGWINSKTLVNEIDEASGLLSKE